jgi:hypothetical protein
VIRCATSPSMIAVCARLDWLVVVEGASITYLHDRVLRSRSRIASIASSTIVIDHGQASNSTARPQPRWS